MILQNLANSSYFKVTGPLTFIQGSSPNTVARNVPKATAPLLYCFNTDKNIYFEVSRSSYRGLTYHYTITGVTEGSRPWRMALTEKSLSQGCAAAPNPTAQPTAARGRAGEGKEGRKLLPPLSTVQMFESTNNLQEQGNTETRTFLKSCNQGESYCYLT